MEIRLRPNTPPTTAPVNPPVDDYIMVQRSALYRLQSHLLIEHERLPGRRLNQALQIIKHMLGGRYRDIV